MADNTRGGSQDAGDPLIATDEVTYSGDTADVQLIRPVHVTGAEGSKTVVDLTSADGLTVGGNVAHDAVDAGNPVKIGGIAADNSPAAVAVGDRVNAWFRTNGLQVVEAFISDQSGIGGQLTIQVSSEDGASNTRDPLLTESRGSVFNGTTWDRLRGNTAGLFAQGNVAHDEVDSGNPIKIGGKVSSAPTTVATGDRVDAWFRSRGEQVVQISGGGGSIVGDGEQGDAISGVSVLASGGHVFNGTTWDRVRSDGTTGGHGVGGTVAHDGADSGNPVKVGGRAQSTAPTSVADGDRVNAWMTREGAQVVTQHNPTLTAATAQYTTTQTSTTIGPTVSASQRLVVTSIQIQAGGTTAGAVQVYFGTGAYSRGTTPAIFDGEFAPSATSKPGYAQSPSVPYMGATDAELKVTTSAAINPLTVTIWYYLVAV